MKAETAIQGAAHPASGGDLAIRSDVRLLRAIAITTGMGWSVLFIVIGVGYQLQLYGDGSIFSYAVAVRDAWAFHWHNISGRMFVYVFAHLPAESYVALTGDARGGIAVYGFLFFSAQLLGLIATFAADRSKGRIFFAFACSSTACLCPLVFGFPTETWVAHAVFWPALAICHYARGDIVGAALVFAALLALVFTHEGALIFAAAILATLALRGVGDRAFLRATAAFLLVLAIWGVVKMTLRPDDYIAEVLARAALDVFSVTIFDGALVCLLLAALAGYGIALLVLWRLRPTKAHIYAASIVAVALVVYWLRFDHALHADNRYYLRTALLIGTPGFGVLAAMYALRAEGQLNLPVPLLPRLLTALASGAAIRAGVGAILLLMLVHAVETAKFVTAWTGYKAAVLALAMGTASDPLLGDPRFVSSARIDPGLNRLSWFSTTQFLSVLLASGFAPARLVVDPQANYFWLSCATARANEAADRAVPAESRRLIRVHACLHRQ
jgi:hypothetical protein